MKKFDKAQKNITTALTIWLIVCIIVATAAFLPPLQEFIKVILLVFAAISALAAAIMAGYVKKQFHAANVMESQIEFLSIKSGSNDRLISDENARSDAEENNEQIKQEKLRQEKQAKAKREAEESKQLDQVADKIAADLDQTADLNEYFDKLLSNFAKVFDIVQGVAYAYNPKIAKYEIKSTYAYYTPDTDRTFEIGEGINGQVAKDKKTLQLDNIPENYIQVVVSGLGQGSPKHLIFIPLIFGKQTVALVELATFEKKNYNLNILSEKINKRVAQHIADNINISAE
ncbi:MAG: GAF domain-containing protein [Bacteroidales bacterium]|nr:GAF domain-containing protein [Bacteroidales bacterium]